MAVQMKDKRANDFRAKADLIRSELMDETKTFTKEEIEKKAEEISALEQRAQILAGYTPQEEIDDQGGDEHTRRAAPENQEEVENRAYSKGVKALARKVDDAFGGPNNLILSLARKNVEPLSDKQRKVLEEIGDFQKRTITGGSGSAEVLLPLEQVQSIFKADISVGGIFDTARRYPVSGRTLRIPFLKQTDATKTRPMADIANVTIVGEASEKPSREPVFDQRLLTVYKWAAYCEFGDEILADDFTGELAPTVQQAVGGQVVNAINEMVTIDGSGSSQPLGAFHNSNPSLYKVARTTADEFKTADAFNMYSRHVIGPDSRWYVHPSVVPQLMNLSLSGTTLVTWLQGLQGAPQMQLLGIPIVVTPLVAVLGDQGDVCLGNGAFYALALRTALTMESSIHYKFRDDITAYRFFARAGGIPIPDGTYSYKATGGVKEWEVSPFTVLDDAVIS